MTKSQLLDIKKADSGRAVKRVRMDNEGEFTDQDVTA